MFWKSAKLKENSLNEIPGYIGKIVVDEMQKLPQTADHWVQYKMAVRPQAGQADSFDARIVDAFELTAKGIKGVTYSYLDEHPEYIQFEGWFNTKTHKVDIKAKPLGEKTGVKAT
jgi:hypothetical protein